MSAGRPSPGGSRITVAHSRHSTIALLLLLALILTTVPMVPFAQVTSSRPSASQSTSTWNSAAEYPLQIADTAGVFDQQCVNNTAYVYCIGGQDASGGPRNAVYTSSAISSSSGNITSWTPDSNPYPQSIYAQACVVNSGFVYCVGGTYDDAGDDVALSYYAPLSSNGVVGKWTSTTAYPVPVDSQYCVASSGYIYCVGGFDEAKGTKATSYPSSSVEYASLSSLGIGTWSPSTAYPPNIYLSSCLAANGYIYCLGGIDSSGNVQSVVYYASLSSAGVGRWTQTTAYPLDEIGQACAISSGYVYCVGGVMGSNGYANAVYYATVSSGGIGTWKKTANYPVSGWTTCVASSGSLYCVGGVDGRSAGENGATYYASLDSLVSVTTSTTCSLGSCSVSIPTGGIEPVPLQAFSNVTVIEYHMQSNVSISTAFMTSAQFSSFNASEGQVSDSVFYQNETDSQHSFHVNQGLYYLVFCAYSQAASVTFSYDVLPVNPFEYGPLSSPQPTGMASFGLYNDSGNLFPYAIRTDEVVGVAGISALSAHSAIAGFVSSSVSGLTLQLNSNLVVEQMSGSEEVYWCQNTPNFVTATLNLARLDNIWNSSTSGFLSNDTVTSEGYLGAVHSASSNGTTQYYYSHESSNSTYVLPLDLVVLMKETVSQGDGVLVQMGLQVLRNGTGPTTPVSWFDNVTIHDSGAQAAYFLVSGNQTTPNGYFYDAELVFGGEENGESTLFPQMNASLGLFYAGGSSENLTAFPSYYSFGGDTAEAADNLHVTNSGRGFSQVSAGKPDYAYLGRALGSFDLGSSSSTVSRSTSGSGGPTTSFTTPTSSTTSSGEIPEFPVQLGLALLVTVAIVASYVIVRRVRCDSTSPHALDGECGEARFRLRPGQGSSSGRHGGVHPPARLQAGIRERSPGVTTMT